MKPSQKLALRLSEVRQRLNELLALDAPSDEERAEMAAKTQEYQKLEPEFRAAVIADGQPEDVETRAEDGESVEYRALVERSQLGAFLVEAVKGREVDGAEAELRAAVFGDDARPNLVPWECLLPRQAAEDRADVATNITTDVARQQQTILGRVFADTSAAFVGVAMPTVAIGQASYPVFTDGASADLRAKGVVKDAEAATITAKTLDPTRLTARYVLRVEDAARLMGLEEALRADLRGALGEELDSQVIAGDGTAPNFSGFLDDAATTGITATTASAKADYADIAQLAAKAIDGRYCRSSMGARLLFNVSGLQTASGLFPTNGDMSGADYLAAKSGGLQASVHMPAKASKKSKVLTWRMDRGMGSAVCPIWQGLEIIRDNLTGAAKGEIALTAIALHAFSILRPAAYLVQEIQEDA